MTPTRLVLALVPTVCLGLVPAAVHAQSREQKRLVAASEVITDLVNTPDDAIPEYVLNRAEAIVVIPSLMKGGLIVGGQHGKGVMSIRQRGTSSWSAPGFVAMTGGSFGWQLGVQSVDLVLVVMNAKGVQALLDSEFKLGANASVAAGPVGRQAEASTDGKLSAEILAYSRARGLFAGLTIEGSSLKNDEDANQHFYGRRLSNEDVVLGKAPTAGPAVRAWTETLRRIAPAGRSSREH